MLIAAGETFSALDRGILDGVAFPRDGHASFKIGEVAPNINMMPLLTVSSSFIMNLQKFNSLPKDVQEGIMSVAGIKGTEWATETWYGSGYEADWQAELTRLKDKGFKPNVYMPDVEQANGIRAYAKPTWDNWLAGMKAKGVNGKDILDDVLKLAATK